LSDRSSVEADGVRISAVRAGEHHGDDWDGEPDGEVWTDAAPPKTGRGGFGEDGDEGGGRRRPRLRPGRGREKTPALIAPPPVISVPAPRAAAMSAPMSAPMVTIPVGAGSRTPSPARQKVLRKRRRRRRALIACTFLTTICTFVTGVGYVYVHRRLDQIGRLRLASLAGDAPGGVMNVLLVGTDSRSGLDGAEADSFGKAEVPGPRSDTIMILHVDPSAEKAAIVSVPRDLYVPIAGSTPDRVNTAFALGGADRLISTIQTALGITINHYVQVDFSGFKDIVDAVGGVTLYVPYAVRDTVSGLALNSTGCVSVDGTQALAWVRSRRTEFLVKGTWQPDGRGDLGRIERQQDFVHRMVKTALASGISKPIQLNRLIGVGARDVTLDSALSTRDISGLGQRFSSLDPDKVVLRTLPTKPIDTAGKAVLSLQVAEAQPILDLLNGKVSVEVTTTVPAAAVTTTTAKGATTTTVRGATTTSTITTTAPLTTGSTPGAAPKPADVRVRVLNGVGSPGVATKAATGLTNLGYTVADKGDAPAIAPKTTIMYATGQLAKAQLLQGSLVTSAVLKEDASLKAVDVNLVLGGDFTGVKAGISSGTAASTTAAPSTTLVPQITSVPLPKASATPPC